MIGGPCRAVHPQVQLTRDLQDIVRNQVPVARKSMLAAYGDVLYRAWHTASGACREAIEDFVQVQALRNEPYSILL